MQEGRARGALARQRRHGARDGVGDVCEAHVERRRRGRHGGAEVGEGGGGGAKAGRGRGGAKADGSDD